MGVPIATSIEFRAIAAPDGSVVTTASFHRFDTGRWDPIPTGDLQLDIGASANWSRRGVAVAEDGTIWVPTLDGVAALVPPPVPDARPSG